MNIGVWCWGRRGSGPLIAQCLTEGLLLAGHSVAVGYSRQSERAAWFAEAGVPELGTSTFESLSGAVVGTLGVWRRSEEFAEFMSRQRVRAVVCTMFHPWNPWVSAELRKRSLPYFPILHEFTPHPGDSNVLVEWLKRRDLNNASGIVTFSDYVHGRLLEGGILGDRPTVTIRHPPMTHGVFDRADSGGSGGGVHYVFLGRVLRYKGLARLVRVFRALREAEGDRVRLTVAGEGDLSSDVSVDSPGQGISIVNRWLRDEELMAIIRSADVVVLPYEEASQSGVVAVALGCGVPVIVSDVGGLREQVEVGRNALVVEAGSDEALYAAMKRLLFEPRLRAELRLGASMSSVSSRTWAKAADDLVAFIGSAVKN